VLGVGVLLLPQRRLVAAALDQDGTARRGGGRHDSRRLAPLARVERGVRAGERRDARSRGARGGDAARGRGTAPRVRARDRAPRGGGMKQILVYGDSLSWGIVPGTRERHPFGVRWPGRLETVLTARGSPVRVIEDCLNGRRTVWDDPFKPGRNG